MARFSLIYSVTEALSVRDSEVTYCVDGKGFTVIITTPRLCQYNHQSWMTYFKWKRIK